MDSSARPVPSCSTPTSLKPHRFSIGRRRVVDRLTASDHIADTSDGDRSIVHSFEESSAPVGVIGEDGVVLVGVTVGEESRLSRGTASAMGSQERRIESHHVHIQSRQRTVDSRHSSSPYEIHHQYCSTHRRVMEDSQSDTTKPLNASSPLRIPLIALEFSQACVWLTR